MALPAKDFVIEPAFNAKFRQGKAQDIITEVLKTKLTNVTYHPDNTSTWTREIADDIKGKLKGAAAHSNIQPASCVRIGGKHHGQMLPNTTVDVTLPFKLDPLLIDFIKLIPAD
mmetsp:Transcript_31668/g.53217  ORF Transcript_31668/g.53217 Transcript_31668/m.53217 type:complete len:114 (+) Transcript_31668:242-583(+)